MNPESQHPRREQQQYLTHHVRTPQIPERIMTCRRPLPPLAGESPNGYLT